jgi:hypothetical protein
MIFFNNIKKFKNFDEVTHFRLINAYTVAIGMSLISPVIITLKGLYLAAWIIAMFSIINTLAVKTNNFMVNTFSISSLYKFGIFIHAALVCASIIYYYSPSLMIWLDSTLVIIEVAIFSAYSIKLNNYITDNYPDSMSEFQIVRNSSYADGMLLGLLVVTIITYFSAVGTAIAVFIVFNIFFMMWMVYNWRFFDKRISDERNRA